MLDPRDAFFIWASLLGFKSMLFVAAICTALLGPSLWRGKKWWLWILPRPWQRAIVALDNEAGRRWLARAKMVFWVVAFALLASWLMLAYHVRNLP